MDERAANDLGRIDTAYSGFVIRDGIIWTPGGYPTRPGDLYAIPLKMQLIDELQRKLETPQQWRLL